MVSMRTGKGKYLYRSMFGSCKGEKNGNYFFPLVWFSKIMEIDVFTFMPYIYMYNNNKLKVNEHYFKSYF